MSLQWEGKRPKDRAQENTQTQIKETEPPRRPRRNTQRCRRKSRDEGRENAGSKTTEVKGVMDWPFLFDRTGCRLLVNLVRVDYMGWWIEAEQQWLMNARYRGATVNMHRCYGKHVWEGRDTRDSLAAWASGLGTVGKREIGGLKENLYGTQLHIIKLHVNSVT